MCQTVGCVLAIEWIAVEIGSKTSVPLLIAFNTVFFPLVCYPVPQIFSAY